MNDLSSLLKEAIDAATNGDLQALLIAQMLLSHLKASLHPTSAWGWGSSRF